MTQSIETRILPQPEERPLLTYEHVRAQVTRTAAAALALASVVAIVCARVEVAFWWATFWVALTAAGYAALRLAMHDYADDVQDARIRARWEAAIEDQAETIDDLEDALSAERETARTLRAENATLRARMDAAAGPTYVGAGDPEDRTVADARTLIRHQAETGKHPAKRDAAELWGWSEARHRAALGRLRAAGIVDMSGTQPAWLCSGGEATQRLNGGLSLAWLGDAAKLTGEGRQDAPSPEAGEG